MRIAGADDAPHLFAPNLRPYLRVDLGCDLYAVLLFGMFCRLAQHLLCTFCTNFLVAITSNIPPAPRLHGALL